jgi:pullulanase/glycogen debranching enzyme
LIERGLSDYWGYNTLAFFAQDARYAVLRTAPVAILFGEP